MLGSTLERSAAALGVMAGLLAAAGPASAQIPPITTGLKAGSSEVLMETVTVKAPADAVTASFSPQVGLMRRDPDRSILTVEVGIAPLHDRERGEVLGVEPL